MTSKGKVDTLSAALLFAGALITVVVIICCFAAIMRRQLSARDDDDKAAEMEKGGILGPSGVGLTAAGQLAATEAWLEEAQGKTWGVQPPLRLVPSTSSISSVQTRPSLPFSDSDIDLPSTGSCTPDSDAAVTPMPTLVPADNHQARPAPAR